MGFFRFRRSVKILPGVRWNLNKGGSSFTFGGRGYKYTVGNKGSRTTVGIPGTGLSYTRVHSSGARANPANAPALNAMPTGKKAGMNKAGCLYTAGAVVLGLWLLGVLNPSTKPTVTSVATPTATPARAVPTFSATAAPLAAIATSPSPTVPTSSVALRATRVFSPMEQARIQKFVPARVKLRQDVEFPATTRNATISSLYAGQGREVAVVRVNGSDLVVEYGGRQATVPIAKTDFLEQVIAETEK